MRSSYVLQRGSADRIRAAWLAAQDVDRTGLAV